MEKFGRRLCKVSCFESKGFYVKEFLSMLADGCSGVHRTPFCVLDKEGGALWNSAKSIADDAGSLLVSEYSIYKAAGEKERTRVSRPRESVYIIYFPTVRAPTGMLGCRANNVCGYQRIYTHLTNPIPAFSPSVPSSEFLDLFESQRCCMS